MRCSGGQHVMQPTGAALALLLVGLLLPACAGTASAAADGGQGSTAGNATSPTADPVADPVTPPAPDGPAVAVAFADALPSAAFTPTADAAIASTARLYAVADWTGVTADQSERLDLVSPQGSSYYALEIPFAETSTSLVSVAVLADGTRRVVFELIVWGSTIESFAQVGAWTANVTLVNGTAAGSATVVLR